MEKVNILYSIIIPHYNVPELLQPIIMLNQAATDRDELAKLLNISDQQLSFIKNVSAGCGLIKVGSSLVPFENNFPKSTKLYKLMTTKPGEIMNV